MGEFKCFTNRALRFIFFILLTISFGLHAQSSFAHGEDGDASSSCQAGLEATSKPEVIKQLENLKVDLLRILATNAAAEFDRYRGGGKLQYLDDEELKEFVENHMENEFDAIVRKIRRAQAKLNFSEAFGYAPTEDQWSIVARALRTRTTDESLRKFSFENDLGTFDRFTAFQLEILFKVLEMKPKYYQMLRDHQAQSALELNATMNSMLKEAGFAGKLEDSNILYYATAPEQQQCCKSGRCYRCPLNYPSLKRNKERHLAVLRLKK